MAKNHKCSPIKVAAIEDKEIIMANEFENSKLIITAEDADNAHIDTPIQEVKEEKNNKEVHESKPKKAGKKKQDKPNKASKRQGVIVEASLATIVVQDENGHRFRLVGVKGNLGDIVEF